MDDLRADEKRCPYCAETIKAAAIKCRWCGSELAAEAPATAPGPGPAEPVEEQPEPQPDPQPDPQSGSAGGPGRLAWLLPAVLAVLVVLAAVVWVRQLLGPDTPSGVPDGATPIVAGAVVTSPEAKQAGMAAATEATQKILSYDAATLGEDIATARAQLSGKMLQQYTATMADISRQTEKNRAKVEATVVAASIISATEHDAKVLLFVNQRTTGKHLDQPRIDLNRVVVTVHRGEGEWSVTALDAL